MIDTMKGYFEALHRLSKNRPTLVSKGTLISLASVALEAGKKKGAIRRNRESFKSLVESNDNASSEQLIQLGKTKPDKKILTQLERLSSDVAKFRGLYEKSLARELSLIHQLFAEREEWGKLHQALTGEKVALFNTQLRFKKKSQT